MSTEKRRGSEYEILERGHPAKTLKQFVQTLNKGETDAALQMLSSDAMVVYKDKIEGGNEQKYEKGTIHDFIDETLHAPLEILGSIDAVGARGEGEIKLSSGKHAALIVEVGEEGKIERVEVIPNA